MSLSVLESFSCSKVRSIKFYFCFFDFGFDFERFGFGKGGSSSKCGFLALTLICFAALVLMCSAGLSSSPLACVGNALLSSDDYAVEELSCVSTGGIITYLLP